MPDRLVITKENQLREISMPEAIPQPGWVTLPAQVVSYVFHPLFMPLYMALFLTSVHPYAYTGTSAWNKLSNLLQVFVNCTFLPVVSVLLLKGLKFIDSIFLKTQKERIIPYVICMIFYFWCWYAFKNNQGVKEMTSMSLAVFNASVFGFLANIVLKVSMHAIAMGVLVTFMALLAVSGDTNLTFYLSLSVLTAGAVCTSRLIVSDHSAKEIYFGFFIGVFSQLAAHYFVS